MVDPVIVGDVNSSGRLDAVDALLVQRKVVRFPVPQLPDLPSPLPVVTFVGPDPALDIPDDLRVQAGERITVPINLDTADGLDSAQVQIRYDTSVLEVEGVRRGSLTGDFQAFVVLDDPGLVQIDMARMNPLAGGSGTLVQIDLRVRNTTAPGTYALDLERASLNAGRLVLNPAVHPGEDPSDGEVLVQVAASVKLEDRPSSLPYVQLRALEWQRTAAAQLTDRSTAPPPAIDWTARPPAFAITPASDIPDHGLWTNAFVNSLGRSEEEANPNSKLRLKLPTVVKTGQIVSSARQVGPRG